MTLTQPLPYVAFFGPACALILALVWRDARRAGYACDRVAAAMAACAVGAVIGSKVLMFDFHAAQYGEKTFLGAVVGGAVSLAIVLKALEFDARAFDVPVLPVIWGHALGRVGCFVSGCCHGIETTAAWGVRYAWLPAPVHPTQLYESLLDVVLALILTRHRDRFERPTSLALTGAIGIALVRFAVEPWRASAVPGAFGLTIVQMTVLAVMLVALGALALRERFAPVAAPRRGPAGSERSALVLVAVGTGAITSHNWLTPLEILIVGSIVSAAALVILYRALPRVAVASPVVGLAVVAPMQSRDTLPPERAPMSWHAIGASVAAGTFEVTTEDCEGNTLSRQQHSFRTVGMSVESYTQEQVGVGVGARFTGFRGLNSAPRATREGVGFPGESAPATDSARHDRYLGATFSGTIDRKWIGLTAGMAAGRWAFKSDYPYVATPLPSHTIPIGGLRIGKLTGLHWTVDVGTHAPSFAPGPLLRVGMASGDSTGRKVFRLGVEEGGLYVSGTTVTSRGFELEPYVSLDSPRQYQFGVGLKKRFYRKP